MELTQRNQTILKAVVSSYIRMAFPVGSATITRLYDFGLSPATIRNIMAELEEIGYLTHPHTSAGRIPTEKGFRFYVESLLQDDPASPRIIEAIVEEEERNLRPENLDLLFEEITRFLSSSSHYAGLVLAPHPSRLVLRHLELVAYRKGQILMILVSEDGLIQHRVLVVEQGYTQAELNRIAGTINERFSGSTLVAIRNRLVREMKEDRDQYNELLKKVMAVVETGPQGELYVGGTAQLLNLPEFSDVDRMKALFSAFEEKAAILRFLNQYIQTEGVRVYIGSENAPLGLEDLSLVVCNYKRQNRPLGTVGVIGPMRMDYSRVIPLVKRTAHLMSRVLEE
jgi:heat-inducible transcriptional repressor